MQADIQVFSRTDEVLRELKQKINMHFKYVTCECQVQRMGHSCLEISFICPKPRQTYLRELFSELLIT